MGITSNESPSPNDKDFINFIFNNISWSNIPEKVRELRSVVYKKDWDYWLWLGHYLVAQRVNKEPHFHELYVDFLNHLNLPKLLEAVKYVIVVFIKVLLYNMKPDHLECINKKRLKNYGKFFGLITLGQDTAISSEDLDLKELVLEAYFKGEIEMNYVLPFVTKVIEGVQSSVFFKPPCKWTMDVLGVLKELYLYYNVKKNFVEFEIEILCKNLKVSLQDITSANYLRDAASMVSSYKCRVDYAQEGKKYPAIHQNTIVDLPKQLPSESEILLNSFFVDKTQTLFQMHPQFLSLAKDTLRIAINKLVNPMKRSLVRIVANTVEHIIRMQWKQMQYMEFAANKDVVRDLSHKTAEFLGTGMALYFYNNIGLEYIQNHLMKAFQRSTADTEDVKLMIKKLVEDNWTLTTQCILTTCVNEVLREVDKRLEHLFWEGINTGEKLLDTAALCYREKFPEKLQQMNLQLHNEFDTRILIENFQRGVADLL